MGIQFELQPYSEEYSYAYVRWDSDDTEFRKWVVDNGHDIEENGEDTPSGWNYIVNLHGKGAAVVFKLTWAGKQSIEQQEGEKAHRSFLAALGVKL